MRGPVLAIRPGFGGELPRTSNHSTRNRLRQRIETVHCQLTPKQQQTYFDMFGEAHHSLEEAWFRLNAVVEKIQTEG